VGFLGFMKKKEGPHTDKAIEVPVPPPPMDGGPTDMPNFSEGMPEEDLKLPEIPELEPQTSPSIPDLPVESMPRIPVPQAPAPMAPPHVSPDLIPRMPEVPKIQTAEIMAPRPIPMPKHDIPPIPKNLPRPPSIPHPEMPKIPESFSTTPDSNFLKSPGHSDEVFIKGEDYREVTEGLDFVTAQHNAKLIEPEKDVNKTEEREHNRFIVSIEQLQHRLMTTESMLFD